MNRAFLDVPTAAGPRRVHYRVAGSGPPLLMVHQSPRSSAEYEALMGEWSDRFTCIAPDTPGFGQSDPLPHSTMDEPNIDYFARATLAFLDALGVTRCAAYGFHSGAIILMRALRLEPKRFSTVAMGGYAVWTAAEHALFSERYLPPFTPLPFGEHLTWLWNRMLEQSWVFPWFDLRPQARLSVAHDDVGRVDAAVREMLDAGQHYGAGYGAVLRAIRDLPGADEPVPPTLITACDGDPLQAHLERLAQLPEGWQAHPVTTVEEHRAASLDWLLAADTPPCPPLARSEQEGFVQVETAGFTGLLHWRGGGDTLTVAAPGRSAAQDGAMLVLDPPGHGLSDGWPEAPSTLTGWQAVVGAAAEALGATEIVWPDAPLGSPALLFPDLSPDRFGGYLTRAWGIVRADCLFSPWYEVSAATARAFSADDLEPYALASAHLGLLQATAARPFATALQGPRS